MQIIDLEDETQIKSIKVQGKVAMLISGQSIPRIMGDKEVMMSFSMLLAKMHSIIVYRSSPS